jgi:DNA-binding NarL/FixJ family response regulator
VLTEKAQELDNLRAKRTELYAALEAMQRRITQVRDELVSELRDAHQQHGREQQVVALVRTNKSNKEIGAALNITERTVKFHVSRLLRKYGVESRHDL